MELSVQDLNSMLKTQQDFTLVDIREPWEVALASIEPSEKIPMSVLLRDPDQLSKEKQVILYCHHGVRSLKTAHILGSYGYQCFSLKGGIDAWSERIDPSCPKY